MTENIQPTANGHASAAMHRWIARYSQRVHFGEFLRRAAEWLAGYLFVFGAAVLVVKLSMPRFWPNVLWLGLGSFVVLAVAWWLSRKSACSWHESVALLDRKLNAGGLLMTLTETTDEQWQQQLPQFESVWRDSLPKLRPTRFAKFMVLPLMFAVGACFVPLREANTAPILRNTVGRQASQELEELLEQLEDAAVLEEEEKEQLREEIDKLTEETKHTPLTHEKWETVDALRERMRIRVDASALTAEKAHNAVAALAKAGLGEGQELSAERLEQLEKDVIEALQKMAKNGDFSGASPKLRSELERLMKNGKFKLPQAGEEREQLLNELEDFLDKESEKLSKLRKECKECEGGT